MRNPLIECCQKEGEEEEVEQDIEDNKQDNEEVNEEDNKEEDNDKSSFWWFRSKLTLRYFTTLKNKFTVC